VADDAGAAEESGACEEEVAYEARWVEIGASLSKITWPTNMTWSGEGASKVYHSPDGRLMVHLTRRYVIPETWNVEVLVYDFEGRAGRLVGRVDLRDLVGDLDAVVMKAETAAVASGLAVHETN